jgi:hypothetical protein
MTTTKLAQFLHTRYVGIVAASLVVDKILGKKPDLKCESCGMEYRADSVFLSDIVLSGLGYSGTKHEHRCVLHARAIKEMHVQELILQASLFQKNNKRGCPLLPVELDF